jgi:hypothetical protein
MSGIDWVSFAFGIIFIVTGLAFFFSRRFGEFAYQRTSQGLMWKSFLGDKWSPVVAKYFFALASIALGAWVIYQSITGSPA